MTTGFRASGSAFFIYMTTSALFGFYASPAAGQQEETLASEETAAAESSTFLGSIVSPFAVQGVDRTLDSSDLQLRHQGDVQSALGSIPNVLTRQSPNQPGIEVNIRGMSGYGRVNSMIDGVPQNFRNIAGHEASGGNMLYVHPELLAGVDVTRGAVSGAKGSGTLTGAVDFRTLSIDDVLRDGARRGAWTRLKTGTNGHNLSGMLALGHRFDDLWGGDGHIDFLLAYAHSNQGNYKTGEGSKLPDGPSGRASTNKPRGALAKIDIVPNKRHALNFGVRTYDNTFQNSSYTWDVSNRTILLKKSA